MEVIYAKEGQQHRLKWVRDKCFRRHGKSKISSKHTGEPSDWSNAQVQGEAQGSADAIKEFVGHLNKEARNML